MEINRRKVNLSMIIPFLTVFVPLFIALFFDSPYPDRALKEFFEIFWMTSPSWGLSVGICLLLEYGMLKTGGAKKELRILLIIETLIAAGLALMAFVPILIAGIIGNILRYQWLVYKKRVFYPVQD